MQKYIKLWERLQMGILEGNTLPFRADLVFKNKNDKKGWEAVTNTRHSKTSVSGPLASTQTLDFLP